MENIVRLSPALIGILAQTMVRASTEGVSVRVCTGQDANGKWFKWDAGAGWTAPQYSHDL